LENESGSLRQLRVFGFISCKLNGQKLKGLRANHPFAGVLNDIYCYDPESLKGTPDAGDGMVGACWHSLRFA
jgi:hypothetical protein